MRILLTGSKGQVGQCLKDRLPEDWELIASDSKTLDITDGHNVLSMVKTFEPDVIINTAGYTLVDKAEAHAQQAFAVNATGTLNLALAAKAQGARFIHLSTDQVFDGTQHAPITECSVPNPINTYGKSKLAGELLALNAHVDTIILRSSWIYSEYGHNFVKSVLRLGLEKSNIPMVQDQIGCPTYAGDLAEALIQFASMSKAPRGIYHFTGHQQTNWCEFARTILNTAASIDPRYQSVSIEPITTAELAAPATRPLYCVLDNQAVQNLIGNPIADTPLVRVVKKLLAH
ncbi:dTDP-4-dehydrorhamnose reductase [Snodgrassella sp. CFCC 13594]|uniref:dTDP-4-dehydrorhamnose reductase n=1 Tax=Snodgrassella sp. CFCC 13594 TaxID=1775559 RepID=UPI00082A3185|nr:dTDP-4-dehydrorhamnose reductase [Snodgrassella sp. CFCC 13594]